MSLAALELRDRHQVATNAKREFARHHPYFGRVTPEQRAAHLSERYRQKVLDVRLTRQRERLDTIAAAWRAGHVATLEDGREVGPPAPALWVMGVP
jgi:hypothetical protein